MTNEPTTDQDTPISLYDRLGGELAVDTLAMAFYANANADERLSHLFENIDLLKEIVHQKRFLTLALGGTDEYNDKKTDAAHEQLNLNAKDFFAFNDVLRMTLDDLGVEKQICKEILEVTKRTEREIYK